ncbi:MAG: hypothetical protein HY094_08070 [Candidatus Melainabacteria bacterium]|nr:hypothetical protein [Candidatus Melainabacteria bacterium]
MSIRTTSVPFTPAHKLNALLRSAANGEATVQSLLENEEALRAVTRLRGLPVDTVDDFIELAAIRTGIPTA